MSFLVVGARTGIGKALYDELLASGCAVWGTSSTPTEDLIELDLTDPVSIQRLSSQMPEPDIAFNCAVKWNKASSPMDLGRLGNPIGEQSLYDFEEMLRANVVGYLELFQKVYLQWIKTKVVHLGSGTVPANMNLPTARESDKRVARFAISSCKAAQQMLVARAQYENPERKFVWLDPIPPDAIGVADPTITNRVLEGTSLEQWKVDDSIDKEVNMWGTGLLSPRACAQYILKEYKKLV